MARTVDTSSTLENFRQEHNNLANDVGAIGNLTTGDTSSIVNAINYIMDQYFFFQDFDFDGSDGATSNTVFSGNDNGGNALAYSAGKILVFKNGDLLRNGTDYTATNGTSVTLASSANNSDVIRIQAFTGSYQNVNSETSTAFDQWQSAGGVIYNKNTGGIVFNADSSITTSPTVSESFQFDGPAYYNDEIYINSVSSTRQELRFRDSDNSNYIGLRAPATVSSNATFTLPAADGSNGQYLKTDGSGNFSFGTVSATAPDVTVTANNSTDETVYPVFVDGATGTQGIESDTGLTYNPSSGILTATQFTGALSGNATTATALATNRNFSISGDITASAVAFNGSGNVVLSATIDDNTVDADALNISGDGSSGQALLSDGDGSFSWGEGGKTTEQIEDIVGGMLDGTETGISVSYDDTDGNIDFVIGSGAIVNSMLATDSVTASKIGANEVNASELNVSGNGTSSQFLRSDGDGTFTWATPTDTNTTYSAGTGMSLSGTTFSCTVTDTNTTYSAGTGISLSGTTFSNSGVTSIVAGSNISISGGTGAVTITATDTNTTYSAGSNMSLSGTTFSATNTTYSAGTGLSLSGTTFSIPQAVATSSDVQFDSFGVGTAASGTTGQIRATNDITAYYSSDIALKENINPISNALDKISQIGGYTFDWTDKFIKDNGGEDDYFMRKKDTGIIAQEIEEVLPEVVATRPNGTKAVKYDKLTPLLIQAIKELKTELDELKSSNS